MEIVEVIKAVDGGIAIAVMLFIGARIDRTQQRQWGDLIRLIDKLTNGHETTTRD